MSTVSFNPDAPSSLQYLPGIEPAANLHVAAVPCLYRGAFKLTPTNHQSGQT